MTEQRIIEIFKANVKAHIKENTPISLVNNLPIEMIFVGLREAAQQIMKEFDIKEVPEYVEITGGINPKWYAGMEGKIFPVIEDTVNSYLVERNPSSWVDKKDCRPSTKEAYEQQQWPKVGETYCYADPTNENLHLFTEWYNDDVDKHRKEMGLIFKTKEEAIARAKQMLGI